MNIFKKGETASRNQKLYSVYDSVAETWGKPFPMKNKGEAIRGFAQACSDPQTALYQNPEDYTLFEIGEWDEDNGNLIMHDAKVSCGVAIEFITRDHKVDPKDSHGLQGVAELTKVQENTQTQ